MAGTSGGIEGWADLEQRQALLKSRPRRYKKQLKTSTDEPKYQRKIEAEDGYFVGDPSEKMVF